MKGEVQFRADRLAVLIDADNANAGYVAPLLEEIAKYGNANVKRIYGNWTNSQLSRWKEKLHKYAIQPIQQFNYTSGKNSTDSALIIDAMDLLYTNNFDGFCIISSDSDFTRLACRLREAGLIVYGFGEQKTPEPFVKACDKFIYTEILENAEAKEIELEKTSKETDLNKDNQKQVEHNGIKTNQELSKLVKNAYEAIAQENSWAKLSELGGQINKLSPSFDSRNYGYKKLGELIRALDMFEIREVPHEKNPAIKDLYLLKKP